ncbi:MAG TPA: hypothetical protein VJZ04_11445 [Lachnospiraceae bacterium]|nr:hypothetical protein [Lachnospiraceae bacterium]
MSKTTNILQSDSNMNSKLQNNDLKAATISDSSNYSSNNTDSLRNPHNHLYPDTILKTNSSNTSSHNSIKSPSTQSLKEISDSYIGIYENENIANPEMNENTPTITNVLDSGIYEIRYLGSPNSNNMYENSSTNGSFINSGLYEIRYLGGPSMNKNNSYTNNRTMGAPALYNNRTMFN